MLLLSQLHTTMAEHLMFGIILLYICCMPVQVECSHFGGGTAYIEGISQTSSQALIRLTTVTTWTSGSSASCNWLGCNLCSYHNCSGHTVTLGSSTHSSYYWSWAHSVSHAFYTVPITNNDITFSNAGGCWAGGCWSWSLRLSMYTGTRNDTKKPNNSPVPLKKPAYRYIQGCSFHLYIPTTDPDGDLVRCRMASSGGPYGDECGSVCRYGSSIDENCILKLNSNGSVVPIAVTIADYPKKSINVGTTTFNQGMPISLVPFQALVLPGTGTCDQKPIVYLKNGNSALQSLVVSTFTICGTVGNISPSNITDIYAFGISELQMGTLYTVNSTTSCISYTWTPSLEQSGQHSMCFQALDGFTVPSDIVCLNISVFSDYPCRPGDYSSLSNLTQRSTGYSVDDSNVLCDNNVAEGWYRVQSPAGTDMPTYSPGKGKCGTSSPVWINGSLPAFDDGNVTIPGCVVNGSLNCASTIPITIKNCGPFNVYYLKSTQACYVAYCFGEETQCLAWQTSTNGFTPNCRDITPDLQTPEVNHTIGQIKEGHNYHQQVWFTCNIPSNMSLSQLLLLDIFWYIDDITVYTEENIQPHNLPSTLRPTHYHNFTGKTISCGMRGKYGVNRTASEIKKSKGFFAGIKIETEGIVVEEGGGIAEITVRSTVPIVCLPFSKGCSVKVKAKVIKDINTGVKCRNSINDQVVGVGQCGTHITNVNWKNANIVSLKASIDGKYDGLINTKVQLYVEYQTAMPLWPSAYMGEVKITVVDKDANIAGQVCQSVNDPHMVTFDGRNYENQLEGEFIMYRHKSLPVEVHAFYKRCNNYATCNCAVAVRVKSDVFILDRCPSGNEIATVGTKRPFRIGLLGCDLETMKIEGYNNGHMYVIRLNNGASVEVSVYSWINIYIKPSVVDWKQTEGLCGSLDGDCSNDFTLRNGTMSTNAHARDCSRTAWWHPNDFSMSWRVPSNSSESLFNGWGQGSTWPQSNISCTCGEDGEPKCSEIMDVQSCLDSDNDITSQHFKTCRTRRAADSAGHDDIIQKRSFDFNEKFVPEEAKWKNGWTEENAKQFCNDYVINSTSGSACSSVANVDFTASIAGCVEDLKLEGNATFALSALESMTSQCYREVENNVTVWIVDNVTGSAVPPPAVANVLCPNECSFSGICSNGSCICNGNRTGEDCSIVIDAPPDVDGLSESICDLQRRPCRKTQVYGDNFLKSENLTCMLREFEINENNGLNWTNKVYYSRAVFISFAEVDCNVPASRRRRDSTLTGNEIQAYGFDIRISNNKKRYSTETRWIIFDSKCWSCNVTGKCQRKENTCHIANKCYASGEVDPMNSCDFCTPNISITTFTRKNNSCSTLNKCFAEGEVDPMNACDFCRSSISRTSFTRKARTCLVNGHCYDEGVSNQSLPCFECNPQSTTMLFSLKAGTCLVNGHCYDEGASNQSLSCFECNPEIATMAFSLKESTCYIGNKCYNSSDVDPMSACDFCKPNSSNTNFTRKENTCYINNGNKCYNAGDIDPMNACDFCRPNISNTNFTKQENTCHIGNKCYAYGEVDPMNSCDFCMPSLNSTIFIKRNNSCSTLNKCFAEGEVDPMNACDFCRPSINRTLFTRKENTCYIGNNCYNSSDVDPMSTCHFCRPNTSNTTFTLQSGYCYIDSTCYASRSVNPNDGCQECNAQHNNSIWTSVQCSERCPDVCKNGGICSNMVCMCSPGFEGDFCETEVRTFGGSIKMDTFGGLNISYGIVMSNRTLRLELEKSVTDLISKSLKANDSALKEQFLRCTVTKLSPGSVVADYTMVFKPSMTTVITQYKIQDEVRKIAGRFKPPGLSFELSSLIMRDYDECTHVTNGCGNNSVCTNLPGTFKCECKAGFIEKNRNCIEVCPGCSSAEVLNSLEIMLLGVGSAMVLVCIVGIIICLHTNNKEKKPQRKYYKRNSTYRKQNIIPRRGVYLPHQNYTANQGLQDYFYATPNQMYAPKKYNQHAHPPEDYSDSDRTTVPKKQYYRYPDEDMYKWWNNYNQN